MKQLIKLKLSICIIALSFSISVKAQESIYSVDFKSSSEVSDWSNVSNVSFDTDAIIGNYMIVDGNVSATAPRSASFSTDDYVCVEFDMMLPAVAADGSENVIGGGNTGGVALMQGTTIAGVIGFRGSGSATPDHILSTGGIGSDYVNVTAVTKATAYRDMWLHYTFLVNTSTSIGDFYITNPTNGVVYNHSGRFDDYISNISSVTNVGIVSNVGYAIGIANLEVKEPTASSIVLLQEDELSQQYLPTAGYVSTVQYSAIASYTITYNGAGEKIETGTHIELESANVEYSILDSNNLVLSSLSPITIGADGLLTIQPEAEVGTYTIRAENGKAEAMLPLTVKATGKADLLEIIGEDIIDIADIITTCNYTGIATAGGIILTNKTITWSIDGDDLGCNIDATTGVLTVPTNSDGGNLKIVASIENEGVSGSVDIQIRTSKMIENSTYEVNGALLTDGTIALASASGVSEIIMKKYDKHLSSNDQLVVKVFGEDNRLMATKTITLTNLVVQGVQSFSLDSDLEFEDASYLKAYITDSNNLIITKSVEKIISGSYKQIPLANDWVTNAKLGNGPGVMSPTTVPAGINASTVSTKNLNVTYQYDDKYPAITSDNLLWYKTGAYNSSSTIYDRDGSDWEQQALPIGNGYLGGMLFGMPGKDHIQFNEETFWAAGYRGVQSSVASSYINPNMSEGINGYMNAGNIFVDFAMPSNATITDYYRDLNIDDAVAHVQYEYDNVTYKREYFASYPAQVMVFRYTSDTEGALNFSVTPISAHPGDIIVNDGEIKIVGKLKDSEPYGGGGNAVYNQESDLEYCTLIKVIADDGEVIDDYAKVNIKNATGVTIIVTAATDYDPNQFVISGGAVDVSAMQFKSLQGVQYATDKADARLANTDDKTYDQLKSEHIADYQRLFNRVTFSLTNSSEICKTPTDELQNSFKSAISSISSGEKISFGTSAYNALDQHLEELHYNYARYLMISSSRETTLPSTLQGKWNQSVAEIWGSCYCININLEMNYWFAGGANLIESGEALIRWLNSQIPAGRMTAKNMYDITPQSYSSTGNTITFNDADDSEADDVFIMHTKQSINGQTDKTGSANIQSPGNMAFLMYNVWDLYKTSGDKDFLKNDIYPILRKAANFYTQYMYANKKTTTDTNNYPNGYYYTTGSGRSPEHGPTQEGIKYDLQLVAGLFDYVIEASQLLNVDNEKVAAWNEIRNNIEMPIELGKDGQIKEWSQEVAYNQDISGSALGDPYHRHISHLVGLYPGNLINRKTPEYLEAAKVVLNKRGDEATGWSVANKFLMWARVLDGNKALQLFRYQLAQRTYQNLFDYHSPFQIDGNFGSAAGVMELLVQSQTGTVYILPALPKVWERGSISGIKTKTGAEFSINWSDNKAEKVILIPSADGDINIGYDLANTIYVNNGQTTQIIYAADSVFVIPEAKAEVELTITFGTTSSIEELKESGFIIYPNPAENSIFIKYDINYVNTGSLRLKISDINGKIVKEVNINNFPQEVDLSTLNAEGSYFATLFNRDSIPLATQTFVFINK